MPDQPEQPWDQHADESSKAFAAFQVYLAQNPHERSQRDVARTVAKSSALIRRWSTRYGWVARCNAYDQEQARLFVLEVAVARKAVAKKHAQIAASLQVKALEALRGRKAAAMTDRALIDYLRLSTQLERDAWGMSSRVEVSGPDGGPIQTVSMSESEEMDRLRELAAEAARRIAAADAASPDIA